jgi:hypothetical protein
MRLLAFRGLLFLLITLAAAAGVSAQTRKFEPGRAAVGYVPVADLCEGWLSGEEGAIDAPYESSECGSVTLTKSFVLTATDSQPLPDTLYLYLEGIAWKGEVYLNGKFLFTVEGPFREHLQAVPTSFLVVQKPSLFTPDKTNELKLVLEDDPSAYFLYPQRVCGILRPVWLLRGSRDAPACKFPPLIATADTVVIFPPWLPEAGYVWNPEPFRIRLAEIRALGARNLYFPFPPSGGLLQAAAELGFNQVVSVEGAKAVAFSHGYPMGLRPGNLPTRGWRDAEGRSTDTYGKYVSLALFRSQPTQPPSRGSLITLLLLPFLFLLLLRIFGPKIYQSFPQYLTKTKINFELIRDSKFLKQEQTLVMSLMQIVLLSASVAMLLYFIQTSGTYNRLNVISAESLLHSLFAGASHSLFRYFFTVLIYLLAITLAKYVMLGSLRVVYGQGDLVGGMANLDVLAAFPFNLLPFVPAAFAFFWKYEYAGYVLAVWMVLYGLYVLRRILLTYAGISHLFKLSASLKILYICTFEILPWVILI